MGGGASTTQGSKSPVAQEPEKCPEGSEEKIEAATDSENWAWTRTILDPRFNSRTPRVLLLWGFLYSARAIGRAPFMI